jgi:hypothetical protein
MMEAGSVIKRTAIVAVLSTLILICWAGCTISVGNGDFDSKYRETLTKDVSAEGLDLLSVSNVNGSIEVTFGDMDRVSISAEKLIKARTRGDAEDYAGDVRVVIDRSGPTLEIKTERPSRMSGKFNARVDYSIEAPRGIRVSAASSNGSITLGPGGRDARLVTSNGGIRVEALGSPGRPGDVIARSSNGTVTLIDCSGKIEAVTSNGRINLEMDDAPAGDIQLATSNGAITARVPDHSDLTVRATTSNGSIRTSLPLRVEESRKTYLRGVLNEGTYRLKAETSNGSITLE